MKKLIWIFAVALLASACSKEETTEVPATEDAVVEEQAEAAAVETTESVATETETLEVVEESAAEAEPENKAILLAQADDPAAVMNWKYKEGQHFSRLIPAQPIVGSADKIEVAEVFMYSCPHCFTLEPFVENWAKTKDPGIRLVRIPAMFNQLAELHAQIYYTEVSLAKNGKLADQSAFRNMVFEEFHRRGNRLTSETTIGRLFVRAGVSEEDFQRTWSSFEVNQAMRLGRDLARRYGITSVPTMIINGKYRTDAGTAGSYDNLFELIDELTVREGLR